MNGHVVETDACAVRLELATAAITMGDFDAAREHLNAVCKEGTQLQRNMASLISIRDNISLTLAPGKVITISTPTTGPGWVEDMFA